MTALLTAAAVVTTLTLLASAANTASRATPTEQHKRGSWGIAFWTSTRNRPLNPHQRRWQTIVLSGKQRWQTIVLSGNDNDARWLDLVAEIQGLEDTAGIEGVSPIPGSYDSRWIDASITNLESVLDTKTTSGDPAT